MRNGIPNFDALVPNAILQKPPREPQGYQKYRTSGWGTISNQMKKEKTMSINKHVDDHNTTGIAQVSIRHAC